MPKDDWGVLKNSKEAYERLEQEVFCVMSHYFRLIKFPNAKQDEYVVIRPLWTEDDPLFTPQTYGTDRDINDMMFTLSLPTSVRYFGLTAQQNETIQKDGVLAAWRRQESTQQEKLAGFCYMPGGELVVGNLLNLYRDVSVPAVEPPPSGLDRVFEHIANNICNGRAEYANYILNWLAHMVQRPAVRPETAISVVGDQGTGKGIFIELVKRMLGGPRNANTTASSSDTKAFNYALGNKLFVVFDEATFAGDRQQSDFMKKLVTEARIRIEQKGLDAYEVDNFARVFITSNNLTSAVPAGIGARRWLTIECRSGVSTEWLEALAVETQRPEVVSWFKYHLQNRDIKEFNPHRLPTQTTGFDAKLQFSFKENPVMAFLWQWITAENLTLYRDQVARDKDDELLFEKPLAWEKGNHLFSEFYEVFGQACRDNFGERPGKPVMGKLLEPYGIKVYAGEQGTRYVLLPHPKTVLTTLQKTSRFDWPISEEQLVSIEAMWQTTAERTVSTSTGMQYDPETQSLMPVEVPPEVQAKKNQDKAKLLARIEANSEKSRLAREAKRAKEEAEFADQQSKAAAILNKVFNIS